MFLKFVSIYCCILTVLFVHAETTLCLVRSGGSYVVVSCCVSADRDNEGVAWEVYRGDVDPSSTSHTVYNLNPSRYYRFRVSAVNAVGESNASRPMPDPAIKMPLKR